MSRFLVFDFRFETAIRSKESKKREKCFELPPTLRHHAHHRVWNRRGYDMNVWSERKIHEKLDYVHNNPVVRGLVAQPGDWPWSGWRHYYPKESSVLAMDGMP